MNISNLKQSLLRRLLKRADYATLDLKPEAGTNHLAETVLIEQIRSGMIAPEDYSTAVTTSGAKSEAAGQVTIPREQALLLNHPVSESDKSKEQIEFAASSNGDRWFLCGAGERGDPFVLHRANPASGGHETTTSVEAFLDLKPAGPEHEALRVLLEARG